MKKSILRIVIILLILIWMRIVFGFSSDNAEKSSSISFKISEFLVKSKEKAKIIQPYIRKIAHLSEYTAGGFLFYGLFLTFKIKPNKRVILSGFLGIVYAISDEIHQAFVPR